MSLGIRLRFDEVRTLAFGDVGTTYMGVGDALTEPARLIFIQNITNETLMFSFNGVTDHFALPANGFLLLDITANKTITSGFFLAEGERLYVKELSGGGSPTSGSIYFSVMSGSDY